MIVQTYTMWPSHLPWDRNPLLWNSGYIDRCVYQHPSHANQYHGIGVRLAFRQVRFYE